MDALSVGGSCPFMWIMLGLGWRSTLEELKCSDDVSGYGDVNVAFCVILVKGQTIVVAACYVEGIFLVVPE